MDQPNLVVEDTDLRRDTPSVMVDGILGNNYTIRRVHVTGGVDNVKVEGDNVRVEASLLDGLDHFDHDPSQNGGATHNDSVQILEGRNVVVTGTTALATDNFALLGGAEWGDITLTATGNYLDGGHCNARSRSGTATPVRDDHRERLRTASHRAVVPSWPRRPST